jgi:hypothetical protein
MSSNCHVKKNAQNVRNNFAHWVRDKIVEQDQGEKPPQEMPL